VKRTIITATADGWVVQPGTHNGYLPTITFEFLPQALGYLKQEDNACVDCDIHCHFKTLENEFWHHSLRYETMSETEKAVVKMRAKITLEKRDI